VDLQSITPLILTYNEEANIARTLDSLKWARQILALDSESTDRTTQIISRCDRVTLISRSFDSHTEQWNFGLEQIRTPWVLTLDADYVFPDSFADELNSLVPQHNAYTARFRYCIDGRPLRGTLYPPRVVLFQASRFRYRHDGHTQLLDVSEQTGRLKSVILHDDRKPLSRWLESQAKYADLEAEKLMSFAAGELSWKDRLRKKIVFAPVLTLLYCLFRKGLILDGWPGIYYTLQRVYAELLLSMKLLERKLRGASGGKS
jgi:glycosyltransferase involved in cell wall biosynthesis